MQTALLVAVAANQPEIVHDLLSLEADINAYDMNGQTALHLAAQYGFPVVLQVNIYWRIISISPVAFSVLQVDTTSTWDPIFRLVGRKTRLEFHPQGAGLDTPALNIKSLCFFRRQFCLTGHLSIWRPGIMKVFLLRFPETRVMTAEEED